MLWTHYDFMRRDNSESIKIVMKINEEIWKYGK